jgi:polysaccharide biosynthesis/export protein
MKGSKTVAEVLSLAGGVRQNAGPMIILTRKLEYGSIQLPNVERDDSLGVSRARIAIASVLQRGADNIDVAPHDVVFISSGELLYVLGAVGKPGSINLNEQNSLTVLEALALAGGTVKQSGNSVRILRSVEGSTNRKEIHMSLNRLMSGKIPDVNLKANDIVVVPDSTGRRITTRMAEAAIQTGIFAVSWGVLR